MQQPARDGCRVELEIGENLRNLDRMRDERLAGVANLAAMSLFAELISAHEELAIELVVQWMLVLAPTGDEVPLLANRCRCRHSRPASAKLV